MILENNFKILIHKFCLQSKKKPAFFKRGSKSSYSYNLSISEVITSFLIVKTNKKN